MHSAEFSAEDVRPEWLFEFVQRIQALIGCSSSDGAAGQIDSFLEALPPRSVLEQRLGIGLLARLTVEPASSSCRIAKQNQTINAVTIDNHDRRTGNTRVEATVGMTERILQSECTRHWTLDRLARRVGCNRTDLEPAGGTARAPSTSAL